MEELLEDFFEELVRGNGIVETLFESIDGRLDVERPEMPEIKDNDGRILGVAGRSTSFYSRFLDMCLAIMRNHSSSHEPIDQEEARRWIRYVLVGDASIRPEHVQGVEGSGLGSPYRGKCRYAIFRRETAVEALEVAQRFIMNATIINFDMAVNEDGGDYCCTVYWGWGRHSDL